MPSPRVVSLLPSATELLAEVGGLNLLVGRSHECDWPPEVGRVPALTGQAIKSTDCASIDREVREQLSTGQSLYTLNEAALAALAPDVIVTQDLCEVCSIDLKTVQRVASRLPGPPVVLSLNPHTVEDILDDVLRVARAVGREAAGVESLVRLRERLFSAGDFVNPFHDGPSVALLEWTDPLFSAGHWTAQLIERAGARHPLNPTVPRPQAGAAAGPQHGERVAGKSGRVTSAELVGSAPEYLVVAPCGLGLDAAMACAHALSEQHWWNSLPAVKNGRVAVVDGNQMFNRPGPRIADAFEFLVGFINERPELIPAGFPWVRMTSR